MLSTDLVYRGYGEKKSHDFLYDAPPNDFDGDIITNPPFKYAFEFVQRALNIVKSGHKVAMFLRIQFLEGKSRKQFFIENPPKVVYVSSSRLVCAKNGDFYPGLGSAIAFAWFVWEKGYKGNTIIKWIN